MRIGLALLLWLAACQFTSPGASPIDAGPDAAAVDGPAVTVPCTNPVVDEPFVDATPCAPWASPFSSNGSLAQGNGALDAMLAGGLAGAAGCTGLQGIPLGAGGAIVEVPEVISGDGTYTQLQLLKGDAVSLGVIGDELRYAHTSGLPIYADADYDPAAMRWWRLRPDAGAIVAEYSADGTAWTMFGRHTTTLDTARIQVIAGSSGGTATGTSRFTRLVMCP